eukprot:scaffold227058_cov18-Tisochrysis_lutea.AAC.1
MPSEGVPCKRTIMQYCTDTLYDQKHTVYNELSTSYLRPLPSCYQQSSAPHVLSGCQSPIVFNTDFERHYNAVRMITKVVSKGCWGLS